MRIFVTHIVPRDKVLKYGLSVAACNFSHNLISGGMFDKVYSILPSFVSGSVEGFDGLVYSSWRHNKILRRLACFHENVKLLFKMPRRSTVWYYNSTILNALLIMLLRVFKPSVRQYMIILDYTPSDSMMARFHLWLTNHMDGTIKLADSPLFTVRNSALMSGVVPATDVEYPKIAEIRREFLISGALNDNIAMLPMLLEAFSHMPDMTLHITGRAPDEVLIESYTSRCSNIHYYGMVEYDEYLDILHSTPFLLSTRNPVMPENQCNFPSKVIEALLHNRIVISTIDYPQLKSIKYIKVDAGNFEQDILKINSQSDESLLQYANQSDKTFDMFKTSSWAEIMRTIENRK